MNFKPALLSDHFHLILEKNWEDTDGTRENIRKMFIRIKKGDMHWLAMSDNGCRPIHLVASNRKNLVSIEDVLLADDINALDSKGNTPLHYAVVVDNIVKIKELFAHGAMILENEMGNTPLDVVRNLSKSKIPESELGDTFLSLKEMICRNEVLKGFEKEFMTLTRELIKNRIFTNDLMRTPIYLIKEHDRNDILENELGGLLLDLIKMFDNAGMLEKESEITPFDIVGKFINFEIIRLFNLYMRLDEITNLVYYNYKPLENTYFTMLCYGDFGKPNFELEKLNVIFDSLIDPENIESMFEWMPFDSLALNRKLVFNTE